MASSFYNANPLLKSVGVNVQYTPEQLDEYVKCAQDPIHFINTHIKIISLDKGLILFKLFDYQEKFIRAIHENRFVISLMPRQSGKTTVVAAYLTWFMLFNANKTVAILANKSAAAREVMSRIQLMIENLPMWLQQGVTEWNKGSIAFENNSKGFTAATSSSGIRGKSCVTGDTKVCVEIDSQFFYIDIELLSNNCTTTNYQPSEAMKYTVYKTTNTLNGKIYVGFHSCPASGILRKEYGALSCFKDGYLGSGKLMRAALKKYAPDIFGQEILGVFDSKVDAEKLEAEIVNSEFVLREDNYNIVTGGNVTIMRRSQETKNNISTAAKLRRDMGEDPPNKGKVAIWHQETNTVRYVDKDSAIPGGWVRGRGSKRAAK